MVLGNNLKISLMLQFLKIIKI